jgi:hypothetical protein
MLILPSPIYSPPAPANVDFDVLLLSAFSINASAVPVSTQSLEKQVLFRAW